MISTRGATQQSRCLLPSERNCHYKDTQETLERKREQRLKEINRQNRDRNKENKDINGSTESKEEEERLNPSAKSDDIHPLSVTTGSGIEIREIRVWIGRAIWELELRKVTNGPLF